MICDSGFAVFDHTADIGLRVWSNDWRKLFETAARGMISLVVDPGGVEKKARKVFQIEGFDLEELLLVFLREILYTMERWGMVFTDFKVEGDVFSHNNLEKYIVRATLQGEKRDIARHDICTEIKAITRHGLSLKKDGRMWRARILFDV